MNFKIYGTYPPYQNQVDTHALISSMNYDYLGKTLIIKSSRLIYGKTLFCIAELIRHAIGKPGSDSVFISPTYSLALENYKKITYSSISSLIKSADQSNLNILFKNKSRIRFFSAALGQSLRGITIKTMLIIDEAAFIKDEVWNEIILPTTIVHKPLIIMTSTPYFKSGFFYNYFNSQLKNIIVMDWIQSYPENLERNKEFLELLRLMMPLSNFKTEYLGLWLEIDDNSLFKLDGNLIPTLSQKSTKYIGIDWGGGSGGDSTAVVGFDEDFNQSLYYRNNDKPTIDLILELSSILRGKEVLAENNSIGKIYIDLLRLAGIKVEVFNTTNTNKRSIIERLITYTLLDKVKLLNDLDIIREFSKYEMQKTPSGLITYNAKSGYHDDIVIASALALYQSIKSKYRVI